VDWIPALMLLHVNVDDVRQTKAKQRECCIGISTTTEQQQLL